MTSVPGILRLADLVTSGRLTHDDVLQMLHPDVSLDPLIERFDRWSAASRQDGNESAPAVEPRSLPAASGNCWIAAIRLDASTPASQFVESVIARRRILPINPAPHVQRAVETGDAIAVYIASTGFLAHAKVAGVITEGSPLVRNSERFTQVVTLSDVAVYHAPIGASEDLVRKIDESLAQGSTAVATPVSRQDFELVTRSAAFSEIR
jgi:hypothetical protein